MQELMDRITHLYCKKKCENCNFREKTFFFLSFIKLGDAIIHILYFSIALFSFIFLLSNHTLAFLPPLFSVSLLIIYRILIWHLKYKNVYKTSHKSNKDIDILQDLLMKNFSITSPNSIDEIYSVFNEAITNRTNTNRFIPAITGTLLAACISFCSEELFNLETISKFSNEILTFAILLLGLTGLFASLIRSILMMIERFDIKKAQYKNIAELLFYIKLKMQETANCDNSNVDKTSIEKSNQVVQKRLGKHKRYITCHIVCSPVNRNTI